MVGKLARLKECISPSIRFFSERLDLCLNTTGQECLMNVNYLHCLIRFALLEESQLGAITNAQSGWKGLGGVEVPLSIEVIKQATPGTF